VSGEAQGGLLLLSGGMVARMALADTYLLYVKAGMRPLLLLSAAVLLVLGGLRLVAGLRSPRADQHDPDLGDGTAGWLLVVPVLAVALVTPSPLGAFAAGRSALRPVVAAGSSFEPLAPGPDGVADLTVTNFLRRALFDERRSLDGARVRLVGLVAPDPSITPGSPGGFRLTRFVLTCCAADARPMQVAVRSLPATVPPTDAWVEVVGTWRPGSGAAGVAGPLPELDAERVGRVRRPAEPYER
jgi:uncharacterized repeat protein (TIGR03943 family)